MRLRGDATHIQTPEIEKKTSLPLTLSNLTAWRGKTVGVYTAGGKLLKQEKLKCNSTKVLLSGLPRGCYLIKLEDKAFQDFKLIKVVKVK